MTIEQGAPPERYNTKGKGYFHRMVGAAFADPGKWFNIDLPEGKHTTQGARSSIANEVMNKVAEVNVREGRVYFRIKEDNDE